MKLIYEASGIEVKINDIVSVDSRDYVVESIEKPRHAGSTGRVYISRASKTNDMRRGYFPSVIKAKWIERGND